MPKVSIVVPVYNVEKYLEDCVESLRNQTLKDIEIILVDDESPDNCPAICDHYAQIDKRIKVVHKKNGGLGFARNTGMEVAAGEYVAFTDSDDYELPNTYEKLYNLATERNCDVVYYKFIDDTFNETTGNRYYENTDEVQKLMLDMVGNPPASTSDRGIQVSSCLGIYRKALIEENHIRFHSERELISEDLIYNLDLLNKARKVVVTDFQCYYYRVTDASLTRTVRNDRHAKNVKFYEYLKHQLDGLGFGREGWLRATRLFIGYTRSTILQMCQSMKPFNEKREWVLEVCYDEVWKEIHSDYPYQKLPMKYRIFYIAMMKGWFLPIWLMSKTR